MLFVYKGTAQWGAAQFIYILMISYVIGNVL